MKKYVKPMMDGEVFVSNEYIAACYKIMCQTPNNNGYFDYLYDDTDGNEEWNKKDDNLLYTKKTYKGFNGCKKWHKGVIRDSAPTANGFVVKGDKAYPVFWWEERLGSTADYHVMVPGKQNYESNPNAS